MESAPIPSRIIRVDQRYRHAAQDVSPTEETVQERDVERREQEKEHLVEQVEEPLLIREEKGRPVMGRAHRMFHRRQADEPNILTVAVEVVATVDEQGNVIAQETVTAGVPSVPPVPTVALPSVPSVPAFPSDLTVPAYPWPSGVPSVTAGDVSSSTVISSLLSTSDVSSPAPTLFPSSLGYNSTISSTIPSSRFFSTNSTSSALSSSSSSTRSSSSSTRSSSTQTSAQSSSTAAATTSVYGGGGGGGPATTAPAPAATSASSSSNDDSDDGVLGTPQVVGSVIGSLAGAALLLALLLFLIKRHKRKQRGGALQLSGNDTTDNAPMARSGQEMATRSSFVPAGAAAFLHRFSGASKSTADTSFTGGERGFQRISGRKLPSAFSEGMTSEQFARGEGTLSGSSFYQDDGGFYGGPGAAAAKEFGKETGQGSATYGTMGTKERMMPSPARTPVVHHPEEAPPWGMPRNGGGSTLSPPHSPNPDLAARPTLGRSQISHDGSRSSRFTENV